MKHPIFTTLLLAALSAVPAAAQMSLVNPVPQKVVNGAKGLANLPKSWKIVTNAHSNNEVYETVRVMLDDFGKVSPLYSSKYTLTYGIKGDKCVKSVANLIPNHAEGYYLSISDKGIVIAGADKAGLIYGVQTLLQSMAEGKLQYCTVTDWPDVPFRGTVEGFYGTPWSHSARLSQIEFYGRNKMNVYIYGPKDDPYHRDQWRKPYPEAEAKRIQELNECAKKNNVNFYWAIHPGVDIKWNDADRDNLVAKLEKMYALGIRAFAVFFDDIWGEGAKGDKQAELLNYVDNNFVKKHHDVRPLIMCPTEYNRAWANDAGGYLRTLGTKMNKSIQIMWTGNSVVHCIDKESMEWINQRIERKAYIWWNFPVSDFVRDHILLGPAYGNGLDIAGDVSGFVSNPMEHAEASKISLYGIADYTWNMKAYDYQKDWEKGLKAVLPSNYNSLRTFALYNKDLGPNGHGFRREEGDEIKDLAAAALKGDAQSVSQLMAKCSQLKTAADVLLFDKTNPELIRELRPWLLQAKNVADYGIAVCTMNMLLTQYADAPDRADVFNSYYNQSRSIQEQMYELENSDVRHALQPGIKVATKVLLPTLNKLFSQTVDTYNKKNNTTWDNSAEYNPYKITTDVPQLALLPISVRGNDVTVAPSLEVIKWPAGAAFTIEGDRAITFAGMEFNLGVPGVAKNFKLELFTNGAWKEVSLLHYAEGDPVIHTGNELGGMQATKLRITNVSGAEQQVYFKNFKFIKR